MAEYAFVPWLRRGVAAGISEVDSLGAVIDAGAKLRATMPVALDVKPTALPGSAATDFTVSKTVGILGPGDVGSVRREAILRTQPADGALGATPGELAYVEFYDEDFPWRYTPAKASASRLRPWIALLVLTDVEFTYRDRADAPPVLTPGPRAVIPPLTETWAWAHAQLSQAVGVPGDVGGAIAGNPDQALSRIMCPRRLVSGTAYHAFLVPAFETGRLAGLGRDPKDVPAQRPAWGTPAHAADSDLPVYFRFSFTTGDEGDFETLARRLKAQPAGPTFGKRPLDVSDPGFGMTARPGATVGLEGALGPPGLEESRVRYDDLDPAVTGEIEAIVDLSETRRLDAQGVGDDPVVVPPVHGRWHAGVPRVVDAEALTQAGDPVHWLVELNLDLRNRAAAGLGAEIVRARQEEYVQRAWEQVGAVEEANRRLREAELARGAADSLLRKHIAQAGAPDRLLVLTAAAQAGLAAAGAGTRSIRGAIDLSAVPAAAQSPAFRRITRPQRPLMRRLTESADLVRFQDGLLTAMNAPPDTALSAAPPAAEPAAAVALDAVQTAVRQAAAELAAKAERPERVFLTIVETAVRTLVTGAAALDLDDPGAPGALKNALTQKVNQDYPAGSADAEVRAARETLVALTGEISATRSDPPDRAVVTIDQAAFESAYGDATSGRMIGAVTVEGSAPPANTRVATVAGETSAASFASGLNAFAAMDAGVLDPRPPDPLSDLGALPARVLGAIAPARTIGDRIARTLPVVAGRPATDPRRMAPVMAYPVFPDPLFEPLRGLSQDHIIPNIGDLPRDTMTVLEPNRRFMESFLAGVNHAFMRELLWREYPTDQRGTSFKVFWDTRDALAAPGREDITAMDGWGGALGEHAPPGLPTGILVLVIRGELLEKFPRTFIYAQRAAWQDGKKNLPRVLDPAGEVRQPILHAHLEPDITLAGFELGEQEARGHRPGDPGPGPDDPGWFFVLMERPGQPRFGMDDLTPAEGLRTWNDLAWDAITFPADTPNIELAANAALQPATAQPATWGRTAADMAAILFQQPVLLARHASEMLP